MNEYLIISFGLIVLVFVVKIIYSYLDFRKDIKEFKKREKKHGKR